MYNAAQSTETTGTEQRRYNHRRTATHAARLAATVDTEKAPELCPPHCRLPPKRSFRSKLRTATHISCSILGKQSSPQKISRPSAMRMKDSDDYITVRAANPRTGLISPSVGTRTPCTPHSPGEALELSANGHISPTLGSSTRAAGCKADEGRRVGSGSKTASLLHEHRRHSNRTFATDTPTIKRSDIPDGPTRRDSAAILKDDQFIAHMPSAREPQPFIYPGYTPEQIEALKHYRQKTRRVSSEGYDQRFLPTSGQYPLDLEGALDAGDLYALCPGIPGQPRFKPYRHENPASITVRKRKTPRSDVATTSHEPRHFVDKFDPKAATSGTALTTPQKASLIKEPGTTRNGPDHSSCRATCFGKSSGSAPSHTPVANVDHHQGETINKRTGSSQPLVCVPGSFDSALPCVSSRHTALHDTIDLSPPALVTDLSCLPRVKLVRPEFAAMPRPNLATSRKCSLGCQEECAEVRKASDATVIHRRVLSHAADHGLEAGMLARPEYTLSAEVMMDWLRLCLLYAKSLEMPRVAVVDILSSSEASTAEKIVALKAVLSLAAHALAICTTLAMLWKLGAAIMHLTEVLLWPLMVPLRILRWIGGFG